MSGDPKADLIYAILAMDAYNRGYGAGINDLDVSSVEKSIQIGDWTIDKRDASFVFGEEAQAAGFYALAYRNGADMVISYRGTDFNDGFNGCLLNDHPPCGNNAVSYA